MRNLKKLLAVVVVAALMVVSMMPAFAADTASSISADAKVCADLGMLLGAGAGVTADYTATQPSRLQAAILLLRLKGLEADAKAFTGTDNFSDVKVDWQKPYTAYLKAHPEVGFAGIGDGKFDTDSKITAQQYYKVVLTGLGYAQDTDFQYADVLKFAADKGLSKVASVSSFTVDNLATATVEGLKAVVKDGSGTLAAKLVASGKIDSAKAEAAGVYSSALSFTLAAKDASTLSLTFSGAAADSDKATFAVTKTDAYNTTVTLSGVTPTWSADKTKVDLALTGKIVAGTYKVTVAGITNLSADKASASVVTKDQAVGTIKILGSKVVGVAGTATATIGFQVLDQYGVDVTKTAVANSINWTCSLQNGAPAADYQKGILTVTKSAGNFEVTDTASITAVDPGSAVTATQIVTWTSAMGISKIEYGTPILPAGVSRIQVGTFATCTIPVIVTDEFGNIVTDKDSIDSSVSFVASQGTLEVSGGKKVMYDSNNKPVIVLDTNTLADATSIIITGVVKTSGKSFQTTINAVKAAQAAGIAFGDFSGNVAAGDTSLVIPITVTDQFGGTLSADDIVTEKAAGRISFTSSNSTVIDAAKLEIATSGVDKGKLHLISGQAIGVKGSTTITMTATPTSKSVSLSVSVVDARTPANSVLASDFANNLIKGASYNFKVNFKDQYGYSYTPSATAANNYYIKAVLTKAAGFTTAADMDIAPKAGSAGYATSSNDANAGSATHISTAFNDVAQANGTGFTMTAPAAGAGNYKLQIYIMKNAAAGVFNDGTATVVDEVDKNITVAAGDLSGLTYYMRDLGKLPGNVVYGYNNAAGAGITANDITSVTVEAKDGSGNIYSVPSSAIFSVTSSSSTSASVYTPNSGPDVGTWFVAGQNVRSLNNGTNTADKTATITAFVNTPSGIQVVSKDVTVTYAGPSVTEYDIWDRAVADNKTADANAVATTDISFASAAAAQTGVTAYFYQKDDFGFYTEMADGTVFTIGSGLTNHNFIYDAVNHKIKSDALLTAGGTDYTANTPIYLTYVSGSKYINVKITITGP